MKTIGRFSFRMPDELKDEVKRISKSRGYPMNAFILQAVWNEVVKERKEVR